MTLVGSGRTAVTSPPLYRGLWRVDRGPPDGDQQYTPGATTTQTSRTVQLAPYAVVRITRARATRRHVSSAPTRSAAM